MSVRRLLIFGWAASVHVQRWARGLAGRGYSVRVVSHGEGVIEGIEVVTAVSGGKLAYVTGAAAAVRAAREFRPDLVHVHYAGGFGLWGALTKIRPLIMSVWGADIVDLPRQLLMRRAVMYALRRADHLTATSVFLKHQTENLCPKLKAPVEVVPFGVDLPPEPAPVDDDPTLRLCFLKAHRPKYGPDLLLRAMARVREMGVDVRLSIAGKGEMTDELKRLTRDLGLLDQVEFVGFVPNDQVYGFLARHHALVMPSTMDSESFGVAVLEAAACGRPAIASRVGGVPEVVDADTTGLLVPRGDVDALAAAITSAARDRERLRRMGQAARRLAQDRYDWQKSLDMMIAVYDRALYAASKK